MVSKKLTLKVHFRIEMSVMIRKEINTSWLTLNKKKNEILKQSRIYTGSQIADMVLGNSITEFCESEEEKWVEGEDN